MLCYVMLYVIILCYVTSCYVSSMNTVQQSDNGASIRDRSEVCLFVCLFAASGTVTASYIIEVFISGLKRPKREGCHCDLVEKVGFFISSI
jgi:uncharacterized membrane protein YjgN (DUF898 family)